MPALITRQNRLLQELLPNIGPVVVSAAYQMTPGDHLVESNAGANYLITLPAVAECAGQFYVIRVISGTATISVQDKGDARVAVLDTMNADNEVTMLYSDGKMWHFIITPPA